MLVEQRDAIHSFKQEVFFLEQFKQEGATLLMDILMHWAFCMHAHLRLAAAALVHWSSCMIEMLRTECAQPM